MDGLIQTLNKFKLGSVGIDDIIFKLNELSTTDYNYEWDTLIANYSKLKYLKRMEQDLSCSKDLLNSLNRFMEQIDKVTQYYLREINWFSEPDMLEEGKLIEEHLTNSLNYNDPFQKMNCVIEAYNILVPIGEDFRREKYIQQIEDSDFIQTFKKRKLNN